MAQDTVEAGVAPDQIQPEPSDTGLSAAGPISASPWAARVPTSPARPGDPAGPGSPLRSAYRQATTVTWLGIVACQIGTAVAVRTEHTFLRSVGVFTNRPLPGAIGVALAFAVIVVYLPLVHRLFGTEALAASQLLIVVPFPFIVWGADKVRRWLRRRLT